MKEVLIQKFPMFRWNYDSEGTFSAQLRNVEILIEWLDDKDKWRISVFAHIDDVWEYVDILNQNKHDVPYLLDLAIRRLEKNTRKPKVPQKS